jgi:hypothetical protein
MVRIRLPAAALVRGRTVPRLLDKTRLHGRHGLGEMNPLVEQRQFTKAPLTDLADEVVVCNVHSADTDQIERAALDTFRESVVFPIVRG